VSGVVSGPVVYDALTVEGDFGEASSGVVVSAVGSGDAWLTVAGTVFEKPWLVLLAVPVPVGVAVVTVAL
jgi:hypothetical protein